MKRKQILIITILVLTFCSCGKNERSNKIGVSEIYNPATAEDSKPKEDMPVITFEKTEHDFGKVLNGERLSYVFKFTNTGKKNLVIQGTESSCGCTTTVPPKAPIRPGETGEIKVMFDSKTKQGITTNTVVVIANTYPAYTILKVNAEVVNP